MHKKNLAIFISGKGSNARTIWEKENQYAYKVSLLVMSHQSSPAISWAKSAGIPYLFIDKSSFLDSEKLIEDLSDYQIELIALAGFLWRIPAYLIQAFPKTILNIHPALLPKYGGKGMYGMHIHRAVIENKEKFSGITIHLVNEKYDDGKILFQEKIALAEGETAETLANKVLQIEHHRYAMVIDMQCMG